ncbi:hypothetical protein AAVH_28144 [Aphelenchoides avenae]|nr:hypothetical protein AAVH_28144 [Aphelenchus avenae]
MLAEVNVLRNFLSTSGILELVGGDEASTSQVVAPALIHKWQMYEEVLITMRNYGHQQRRLYGLNDSYVDANEDAMERLYATDPGMGDVRLAARHAMEYDTEALELVKRCAGARLSEAERAVLTLLLLLEGGQMLACNADRNRIAAMLNSVFRDLHKHYERNCEDTALRLDKLVQLAHHFQSLFRLYDEHLIIMRLSGKQTIMSKFDAELQEKTAFP